MTSHATCPSSSVPAVAAMLVGTAFACISASAAGEGVGEVTAKMETTLRAVGDALARSNLAKQQLVQQAKGAATRTDAQQVASDANLDVEKQLLYAYMEIEHACATNLGALSERMAIGERKGAHVNAWGGLLALIGGVTVYAPAKAVLMGVGISSSGGSGSVLGGLASSVSKSTETSAQAIRTLKQTYTTAVDGYEAIKPEEDDGGHKRFSALLRLRAACDGLMGATVAGTE